MAAFLPLPRDSNELILLNVNEDRWNGNFILRGIYIVIVKSNIGVLNLVLNNFAVLCIFVKITWMIDILQYYYNKDYW